jgi:hypothetical protein
MIERFDDQRLLENPSALPRYDSGIVLPTTRKSKMSDTIVSSPIFQDAIFRFSMTSAKRCE